MLIKAKNAYCCCAMTRNRRMRYGRKEPVTQAIGRVVAGNGDRAMETFGQRLRGFRKASGLHQEELADMSGCQPRLLAK